jgi:hypothetical protein
MNTPNTEAGRMTEKVMLEVKTRLPKIETHEYNRIYEAVNKVLSSELQMRPKRGDVLKFPGGGGVMF